MESSINLTLIQLSQVIAILLTGLLAGLFYGYDCSVIRGLEKLQDDVYLQSFQHINKAIQNPYFFISFIGSLLVLPVATWLSYGKYNPLTFYLLLSATLLYAITVFGVTVFGNIPLNELLEKFDISTATQKDIVFMRQMFENSWNKYHTIRTIAAILTFCLTIIAVIKQKI
ncbi:MAG: DUF1772 domain-containing protein [Ferruginibacter sp.]|nr:DUF1772 domain-containing protein [Ferruginibacter sp.]